TGATWPTTGAPEPDEDPVLGVTDALGPEAGLLAGVGRDGFADALEAVATALRRRPSLAWPATGRYVAALTTGGWAFVGRSFGLAVPPAVASEPGDRRFRDPAWT